MSFVRALAVAALVAATPVPAAAQSSTYEQLQTLSGLLSQVRVNYVDSVTAERLVRGAIDGILSSLDPHSYFLSATDAQRMILYRGGELGGAGMELEDADDAVVVQSVIPRSPADRVGIQPGDRINAINDTTVRGMHAQSVSARLVGERGQRVRIALERGSRFEPETMSVRVRLDRVERRSIYVARTVADGIGYVRLEHFGPDAAHALRDAAERVMRGRERRLILDLRGNPGGIVDEAQELLELFLPRDRLIFSTRGRRRETDRDFRTRRDGPFADVPLVVLVDERSASAAEAVAGALQDHDRALVMGRRSFGKALMQRAFLVPPRDDIVMLTVGWVVLPSGRLIQRRYRGMSLEQYHALAGRAPGDTTGVPMYRTAGGRPVEGGGGVVPDSALPAPPPLPLWWTAAADSGFQVAVADSAAATMAADAAARDAWCASPDGWHALLAPFLARTRSRFGIAANPDSAVAARMARNLALRVVEVRWGMEAAEGFRLLLDPVVRSATDVVRTVGVSVAPLPGR